MLIAIAAVRLVPFARRAIRLATTSADDATFAPRSLSEIPIAAAPELPDSYWQDPAPEEPRIDLGAQEDAEQILGDLGRVQVDLLSGRIDLAGLRRIDSLANGLAAADPGLNDICKAIAIRARVEVARVEYARAEGAKYRPAATSPARLFR